MSHVLPIRILGTGEYVPRQCVRAHELDERWNQPAGWAARQAGIECRHYADAEETTSTMGASAAQAALAAADIEAGQLDCIVSACSVMEQALPCSAVLIQRKLGLGKSGIPAFDINATCLSFLAALDTMSVTIAAGRYERVLIVSSEIPSSGLPEDDVRTTALFGDGAGAVVLARGEDDGRVGVHGSHFETYSVGAEFCRVRSGGTRMRPRQDMQAFLDGASFEMHGPRTFRMAALRLPAFLDKLFQRAGVALDDIDCIVPHQASAQALAHLENMLGLSKEKMVNVLARTGNQMAASIPVALHRAVTSGRIRRGDMLALVGSGAGLSFGGSVLGF